MEQEESVGVFNPWWVRRDVLSLRVASRLSELVQARSSQAEDENWRGKVRSVCAEECALGLTNDALMQDGHVALALTPYCLYKGSEIEEGNEATDREIFKLLNMRHPAAICSFAATAAAVGLIFLPAVPCYAAVTERDDEESCRCGGRPLPDAAILAHKYCTLFGHGVGGCLALPVALATPVVLVPIKLGALAVQGANTVKAAVRQRPQQLPEPLVACEPRSAVRALLDRRFTLQDAPGGVLNVRGTGNALVELDLCKNFPKLDVESDRTTTVIKVRDEDNKVASGSNFGGNLVLFFDRGASVRLPRTLRVGEKMLIYRKSRLDGEVALMEDLSVGDTLAVRCRGHFSVLIGSALRTSTLDLQAASLHTLNLAQGLTVLDFSVWLGSSAIDALPSTLREVRGALALPDCERLESLPSPLVVRGDLFLSQCVALQALPEDLHVTGDLYLSHCVGLALIPASLRVDGASLDASGCESLFEMPLEPLLQPRTAPITVRLGGSSIVGEALEALEAVASPQVRIAHVGVPHRGSDDDDSEEQHVLAQSFADVQRVFGVDGAVLEAFVEPANRRGVLRFLSKLQQSAEFQDEELREGLVTRTREVLELVIRDDGVREELLLRMSDSADACADKPVLALSEMLLVAATARARGSRAALRTLGRGVMRLAVVRSHAERMLEAQGGDDVSAHLGFELALRDELELPVSAQAALYASHIPSPLLKAARAEALALSEAALDRWLDSWPEWQRQLRLEAIVPYGELHRFVGERVDPHLLAEAVDVLGEPVRDPVFALPDTANVWSYADLVAKWERNGTDMGNRVVSPEAFVSSVVRRLADAAPQSSWRESLRKRLSGVRRKRGDVLAAPGPQDDMER